MQTQTRETKMQTKRVFVPSAFARVFVSAFVFAVVFVFVRSVLVLETEAQSEAQQKQKLSLLCTFVAVCARARVRVCARQHGAKRRARACACLPSVFLSRSARVGESEGKRGREGLKRRCWFVFVILMTVKESHSQMNARALHDDRLGLSAEGSQDQQVASCRVCRHTREALDMIRPHKHTPVHTFVGSPVVLAALARPV